MKNKIIHTHMNVAFEYASLSYCKRKQVGCIFVKDDRVVSIGYNGTPPGWENVCEDENNVSKKVVYHAEANAVAKLAKSGESGKDASVFITCSPCIDCAKLLAQVGVKEVFYSEVYRDTEGVDFLKQCGIKVTQIKVK